MVGVIVELIVRKDGLGVGISLLVSVPSDSVPVIDAMGVARDTEATSEWVTEPVAVCDGVEQLDIDEFTDRESADDDDVLIRITDDVAVAVSP